MHCDARNAQSSGQKCELFSLLTLQLWNETTFIWEQKTKIENIFNNMQMNRIEQLVVGVKFALYQLLKED